MGLLRLFLAISVIAGHAQTTVFGVRGIGALYAVNFFFIISGFYMAMVLNGKYKEVSNYQFYKSRILRLFPAYYIGLLLAIVVSYYAVASMFANLDGFSKFIYVFQNLFIVGQDLSYIFCVKANSGVCADSVGLTINPPAWSLAVELGFYLVAPFFIRSQARTFVFVMVGAVYLAALNQINFPLESLWPLKSAESWAYTYYFYPSSFAFFGGGALAYHLSKNASEPHYVSAIVALLVLSASQTIMPFWHLLFFSMAIPVLFNYTAKNKFDRVIGELSYPVYILHFPILIFAQRYFSPDSLSGSFLSLGTIVTLASLVFGLAVYYFVERRVANIRHSDEFFSSESIDKVSIHYKLSRVAATTYIVAPFVLVACILVAQAGIKIDPENTPYNLSDSNWGKGIGLKYAAFFVKNTKANIEAYKVGSKVTLSGSGVREIIKVEKTSEYLNVFVSGDILSADLDGYPHKIVLPE